MLIACSSCRRQYDVAGINVGEEIRCLCGELNTVPEQVLHEARTVHCSSCGGRLRPGARSCDYCGGLLNAADRDLGAACPECFARLGRSMGFCPECGVEVRPERLKITPVSSSCPRCERELSLCALPDGEAYTECRHCGGLWLDEETFERLLEHRESSSVQALTHGRKSEPQEVSTQQVNLVRYLKCPRCQRHMNRKNFARISGVVVDWCKGHGWWFDANELQQILDFAASGGLERSRAREREEHRRQLDQKDNNPLGSLTAFDVRSRRNPTFMEALVESLGEFAALFHRDRD